jgi:hypothetical protein
LINFGNLHVSDFTKATAVLGPLTADEEKAASCIVVSIHDEYQYEIERYAHVLLANGGRLPGSAFKDI